MGEAQGHAGRATDPQLPGVTKITELDDDLFKQAKVVAADAGIGRQHEDREEGLLPRFRRRRRNPLKEELPEGKFRYQCMTGKRDRNKGTYYGLVKAMMDPQRFVNKLYSEVIHIIRTNAKGGLIAEEGAIKDVRKFEDSYAQADAITYVENGTLSNQGGARIQPKVPPPIPPAVFSMMEFARDMVRACTGVNEEILGLWGEINPACWRRSESRRRMASWGRTSTQATLYPQLGRPDPAHDARVHAEGRTRARRGQGTQQYVELALTMEAEEYDVVVDEAPNTPNQKAKVAAVLLPLIEQMLTAGILGPEDVGVVLEYVDIPASLATELQERIRKRAEAQQPSPEQQQFQQQAAAAEIEKQMSEVEKNRATAFKTATDAHLSHAKAAAEIINPPPPPQIPEDA